MKSSPSFKWLPWALTFGFLGLSLGTDFILHNRPLVTQCGGKGNTLPTEPRLAEARLADRLVRETSGQSVATTLATAVKVDGIRQVEEGSSATSLVIQGSEKPKETLVWEFNSGPKEALLSLLLGTNSVLSRYPLRRTVILSFGNPGMSRIAAFDKLSIWVRTLLDSSPGEVPSRFVGPFHWRGLINIAGSVHQLHSHQPTICQKNWERFPLFPITIFSKDASKQLPVVEWHLASPNDERAIAIQIAAIAKTILSIDADDTIATPISDEIKKRERLI